ncbi:glycosyltransferase family 39 protein [Halogeometricum sp. S1BR25-6]|uniref:Glycosyltransferase family 39 protein n=1 Tax=Halogeometricum salsisoli TaxID=2950536 RepID=A0ABU2GJ06_9EURY|nr:glycosyltransferase family 39 protein [Halogeometricum sp. S1BR25-6]MDS0300827.1 glycosyltransferase family 39 protein [Halogeometricum sp. S1BR25-6]
MADSSLRSRFARSPRHEGGHPLDVRDRRWLVLAVLPALVSVAVYLATNPYPAYGAGLYAQIAREIAANGYLPPARIPGYTADGVPFAYPPLQFYVFAVLRDIGFGPVAVARFLPAVAVVAVQIPVYVLARDLLDSRPAGTVAAAGVALNPQILEWHLSAGGVVRGFAFLYALTAICAGYRLFTTGDRRALVAGVVAFGLTVLSHPTYTLFTVVSYLLLWLVLDRSLAGLLRGAVVGVGGAVIASPWLLWAVSTHGPDVFTSAAGTHGGIGGGVEAIFGGISLYTLVPLLAAAYLLAVRRDLLLPAWVAAAELLFQQPRFVYTVGTFALVAAGFDAVRRFSPTERFARTLDGRTGGLDWRAAGVALLVVVASLGGGTVLAYQNTLPSDPSTPEFLDDEAVDAMAWAAAETPSDATFVVLGDAAEWFPALTQRTILVGMWGVEWEEPEVYEGQTDAYVNASTCQSATCVETAMQSVDANPDYVYVPKGHYTVRGASEVQFGTLERSFEASQRWELAFENDGVAIYRSLGEE